MVNEDLAPLVTIALPVLNGGVYLRNAVKSILGQSYAKWELFIIDDGSSDNAIESIRDIRDVRITILSDGHKKGLAARLNEAIDRANGRYFARMDHDDISLPGRLAAQVCRLNRNPDIDVLSTAAVIISAENDIIGCFPAPLTHSEICRRPWLGFYMPHPTWMGRIEWFRKNRYRRPQSFLRRPQSFVSEDQELLLRSYRNSTFGCLGEIHFAYRVHRQRRFGKTMKIRLTVWRLQVAEFSRNGPYRFMFYSTAALFIRIVGDIIRTIAPALAARAQWRNAQERGSKISDEWDRIVQTLRDTESTR